MALKLNIDWFSKRLLQFTNRSSVFTLPSLAVNDILPIEVQILQPESTGYATPDISNLGLTLTLEDPTAGTIIASQTSWTKDVAAGTFNALVDLGTAAMGTWISTALTKDATLKITRTDADGSSVTILQETVEVVADKSGSLPSNPTIGTTPLTLEMAVQMFAKKRMDAGDTLTFVDQDGTVSRTLGVYVEDGDTKRQDDIASL